MKNSILLALCVFLFFSCSNDKPTSWEYFNLKGKVSELVEKEHDEFLNNASYDVENDSPGNFNKTKFTESGEYIGQEIYDYKGELEISIIHSFEGDKVMDMKQYDNEGKLFSRTDFNHKNGNPIGGKQYDGEGSYQGYSEMKYDGHFVIESIHYDKEDNVQFKMQQKFKNRKVVERRTNFIRGNDETVQTFEYNKDGFMTKVTTKRGEKESTEDYFEFIDFDEQGNWTKRITKENEKVTKVTTREIKYF